MYEQPMNDDEFVEHAPPPTENGTRQKTASENRKNVMERWNQRRQEVEEHWHQPTQDQRTSILNRLKAHGLRVVVVHYSGYGDEGSVNDIEITDPEDQRGLLDDAYQSAFKSDRREESPSVNSDFSELQQLAVDIEKFCTDSLEHHIGGWEVDEGSDGTFTFDVVAGTVTCSHDQYYRESYNETWEV